MKLSISWINPIRLRDERHENLIYGVSERDWNRIPNAAGIYIFAKQFGGRRVPLYIGQAINLQARVGQQLESNVPLMMGLFNAKMGPRLLLVGRLVTRPGQQRAKVLNIVEKALIESALTEGFELLNVAGTKTPTHSVASLGPKKGFAPVGREMLVRR